MGAPHRTGSTRTPAASGTSSDTKTAVSATVTDGLGAAEPVRSPRIFRKRDTGLGARPQPGAPVFPTVLPARPGAMFIPRQQLTGSGEPDTLSGPSPFGADRARPADRQARGTRRGAHRDVPVRQPAVRQPAAGQPRLSRNRLVATGTASLAGISALLTGIALAGAHDEQVVDLGAAATAPSVGLGSSPSVLQGTADRTPRSVHRPVARPVAPPPRIVTTPGSGLPGAGSTGNDSLLAAGAPSSAGADLPQAVATYPESPYPTYSYYSGAIPDGSGLLAGTPAPTTQSATEQPAFPSGAVTGPIDVGGSSEPTGQPTTTTLRGFETGQTPLAGTPIPTATSAGVSPTPAPSATLSPTALPATTGSSAAASQPPASSAAVTGAAAPAAQAAPQPSSAGENGSLRDKATKLIEFYGPPPFLPLSR
ncbi:MULTISPECIES: hypothetical protein [Protofrankia]|uniref:hypothetical protein n=1 Tax=Protofrankia TaxID=2994361 RepID=UPI0005BA832C|nr:MULTISPECIES: hypothetical protein [Protofrankia]